MDLDVLPITIYSVNKNRLTDFLSDVFEFDYDSELGLFCKSGITFEIVENETSKDHSMIFKFKLKSEKELKEIISKFNFFLYRNSDQFKEKLEIFETENMYLLSIFDLDNRKWLFRLDKVFQ